MYQRQRQQLQANDLDLITEELMCPLTHELMRNPVTIQSGHTYDREFIQGWFDRNNRTNPLTGLPLNTLTLHPNIIVRNIIQKVPKISSRLQTKQKNFNQLQDLLATIEQMWNTQTSSGPSTSTIRRQNNFLQEQNQKLKTQLSQKQQQINKFKIQYAKSNFQQALNESNQLHNRSITIQLTDKIRTLSLQNEQYKNQIINLQEQKKLNQPHHPQNTQTKNLIQKLVKQNNQLNIMLKQYQFTVNRLHGQLQAKSPLQEREYQYQAALHKQSLQVQRLNTVLRELTVRSQQGNVDCQNQDERSLLVKYREENIRFNTMMIQYQNKFINLSEQLERIHRIIKQKTQQNNKLTNQLKNLQKKNQQNNKFLNSDPHSHLRPSSSPSPIFQSPISPYKVPKKQYTNPEELKMKVTKNNNTILQKGKQQSNFSNKKMKVASKGKNRTRN